MTANGPTRTPSPSRAAGAPTARGWMGGVTVGLPRPRPSSPRPSSPAPSHPPHREKRETSKTPHYPDPLLPPPSPQPGEEGEIAGTPQGFPLSRCGGLGGGGRGG